MTNAVEIKKNWMKYVRWKVHNDKNALWKGRKKNDARNRLAVTFSQNENPKPISLSRA